MSKITRNPRPLHDLYAGRKSDAELTEMVLLMLGVESAPLSGKGPEVGAQSGNNGVAWP
ncbi:hypothetical protein [Pseudomonas sp. MWU13-2100]|uniref:hypothetical protein n=1 Tax=Pseudomonas sp. MWU13-2100 TaxID=2935075 RepID=UPI00200DD406|nr:hypothetical protein [Pseudomonas sp. MWU13-2100]